MPGNNRLSSSIFVVHFFVRVHEIKSAISQLNIFFYLFVLVKQTLLSTIVLSIGTLRFAMRWKILLCYGKRSSNFHCCNNIHVCNVCMNECNVYRCIV